MTWLAHYSTEYIRDKCMAARTGLSPDREEIHRQGAEFTRKMPGSRRFFVARANGGPERLCLCAVLFGWRSWRPGGKLPPAYEQPPVEEDSREYRWAV